MTTTRRRRRRRRRMRRGRRGRGGGEGVETYEESEGGRTYLPIGEGGGVGGGVGNKPRWSSAINKTLTVQHTTSIKVIRRYDVQNKCNWFPIDSQL